MRSRLAWLAGNNGTGALSDTTFRVDAYEEIQRHNQSFQEMTAYVPFFATSDAKMTGSGEPRALAGVWVTGNFFSMLGIQPQLGRLFTPEETVKGGRPAVLLSYPFWQRQFAGNPAIVGQAITLNDTCRNCGRRVARQLRLRWCLSSRGQGRHFYSRRPG